MKSNTRAPMTFSLAASGGSCSTRLYPLAPMALGTDQCESIFSYLSRLATAHHVSIARLVQYLDEVAGHKQSRWFAHLSQGKTSHPGDTLIPGLIAATGRPEISGCTFESLSEVTHFRNSLRPDRPRHCPACVAEVPFPGAWNRLIWEIQFVHTCPIHDRLLVSSACGRRPEQWEYQSGRALRPGVCRYCGSIAFGCVPDEVCPATPTQRWVAVEVGRLIAASSGGERFTREAMLHGLHTAIKQAWRNVAEADRALGLPKGHLNQTLKRNSSLDFQLLIAISSHVRAQPVSVLRGQLQAASMTIEPIVLERQQRRRATKSNAEIEKLLPAILVETPDITFTALAEKLGVNVGRLTQLFPELVFELRERRLCLVRRRRWLRLLRIGRNLRALKARFEHDGLVFNRSNLFEHGKTMLYRGGAEERLFLWVKERTPV